MSGHSKWANIKHRKEKADKKKGKIFSRLAKEIISAVKQGGSDPKCNAKLKLALLNAKAGNLPNEIIERNIKKANSSDQADFTAMTYELYGYGGVGIILDILTDNKNRISSEIHIATNKCGGTVASPGSVQFNFERKGVIRVEKDKAAEEDLFLTVSEAGAEDFSSDEGGYIIYTSPEKLNTVVEAIKNDGIIIEEASLEMIPKSTVECSDVNVDANMKLIDWLENLDDVDALYHNLQE